MNIRYSNRTKSHDIFVFSDDSISIVDHASGIVVGALPVDLSLFEALRNAFDFISNEEQAGEAKSTPPQAASARSLAGSRTQAATNGSGEPGNGSTGELNKAKSSQPKKARATVDA